MNAPVKVTCGNSHSYYRINVGTILKIKEATGLDFFGKDDEKNPGSNPVNAVQAIQAIADPKIDLSSLCGKELVQIYTDFMEEVGRFFPLPDTNAKLEKAKKAFQGETEQTSP
jgi:hypothetical protein